MLETDKAVCTRGQLVASSKASTCADWNRFYGWFAMSEKHSGEKTVKGGGSGGS